MESSRRGGGGFGSAIERSATRAVQIAVASSALLVHRLPNLHLNNYLTILVSFYCTAILFEIIARVSAMQQMTTVFDGVYVYTGWLDPQL